MEKLIEKWNVPENCRKALKVFCDSCTYKDDIFLRLKKGLLEDHKEFNDTQTKKGIHRSNGLKTARQTEKERFSNDCKWSSSRGNGKKSISSLWS